MNVMIIDDEAMSRAIVIQMLSFYPEINVVCEFSNAIEAIKYLNQEKIDVVFLDINMPEFTGFDFIKTIKNSLKIVLITSDRQLASEAFEYDCIVDFLVKPILEDRLNRTIKKLESIYEVKKNEIQIENIKYSSDNKDEFFINIDRRLIKIEYASINVIEAKGDYIIIKTDKENYKVHSTLKKIEEKIPMSLFLKVHRSYIINVKKIIDIEDNSVLISKNVIPISRSNRPELMKLLNLL